MANLSDCLGMWLIITMNGQAHYTLSCSA